MKSGVFNISISNENILVLVKMRGQSSSDDVALPRDMTFFCIFSHLNPFLAKDG